MRLLLREDLGGTLARLKHLSGLADIKITKPLLFFKGPNGCGKSAILEGMRTATHRFGVHFGDVVRSAVALGDPLTTAWGQEGWNKVDLAKHALLRNFSRWPKSADIQIDDSAPGAFDTRALLWRGQETFYFTSRHEYGADSFDLPRRRQMNEDNMRSHGEKMAGELNYALAWGLGLIDTPEPKERYEGGDIETAKKNIAAYLKGASQTKERWLFLDEPETGVDEARLANIFSLLAESCKTGHLRTFCATHSPMIDALASHPKVQIIDIRDLMDNHSAPPDLAAPGFTKKHARLAISEIEADMQVALKTPEHPGQGRFTIHRRRSIPPRHTDMEPYGGNSRGGKRAYTPPTKGRRSKR
ncbi:ATP-binding protein [Acetobacter persici]|uniref:ATPase AAA-type core domain-containing protein n=1 Tax=Acetobacter persici TaxID=1076596 RepID=A0A1U9LJF5_9PROT|nr:ATP-binding protein [Acetobacter persici]AQT06528.1 hypothetical protein A0U91_16095 [Acetobacter persici]